MIETSNSSDSQPLEVDNDEINLLDLVIVLAKRKKLIFGLPLAVAVVVAGISLTLPNVYTGSTKILPPQQGQSGGSAMMAQLSGLAGLAGGLAGIKSPNDLYVGMLRSRTVADNIIQRFGLTQVYEAKYPSQARQGLAGVTNVPMHMSMSYSN
ncbi:MAG: Wzz/FepE/Etk N-terminal domain-containing protein [Proteobacteria bacterium]|nr:Wzz/FepE/Etk N-terminal domain-containing protein [Pseudomonadota bacterium]